jgi:competence CoiA-like predicted nuclease
MIERTLNYTNAGHPVMWVWGHRESDQFSTRMKREFVFKTSREEFIQNICGENLYYTKDGLFSGSLYGKRERKKFLFANKIGAASFKLCKYESMEYVTLR